jgi:AcrR family transcriptional regulator
VPRAGLTRQRVIDEAQQLSDEAGPDGLTLAALADRLGVRQPSLYKHIGGSADLDRELALRAKRELADVLARASVGRSGAAGLRSLSGAYRRWALAHPGRYAATVRPLPEDPEDAAASASVVSIVVDVLAAWGLDGEEAVHATRAVRAALHGFISLEVSGGFALPLGVQQSFDRLVDVLVEGLGPGGAPASDG